NKKNSAATKRSSRARSTTSPSWQSATHVPVPILVRSHRQRWSVCSPVLTTEQRLTSDHLPGGLSDESLRHVDGYAMINTVSATGQRSVASSLSCFFILIYTIPIYIAAKKSSDTPHGKERKTFMAAFDRILSGYSGLDEMLDSIRLGDNVVWQVDDVKDFCIFAEPFVRQAVKDH